MLNYQLELDYLKLTILLPFLFPFLFPFLVPSSRVSAVGILHDKADATLPEPFCPAVPIRQYGSLSASARDSNPRKR